MNDLYDRYYPEVCAELRLKGLEPRQEAPEWKLIVSQYEAGANPLACAITIKIRREAV